MSERSAAEPEAVTHFVAGERDPVPGPWPLLADELSPTPSGVALRHVECLSRPGDLVVDPFGTSPRLVREIVSSGRRVIVGAANPVARLALRAALSPPRPDSIAHALARLGDAPRENQPVQRYVRGLYATLCPSCGATIEADFFVWEREPAPGQSPIVSEKGFRCPACHAQGSAPADTSDVEHAQRIEPRGFHYYYALDRAAPTSGPVRERLAELVESYPPRALHALVNLLTRMERLILAPEDRYALSAVLLAASHAACPLSTRPAWAGQPTRAALPARYREVNVWLALEEAASRLSAPALPVVPVVEGPHIPLAGEVPPVVHLAPTSARGLAQFISPGSVSLLLTELPRLDPTFWALSALWSAWLWGAEAAHPLLPAVRQHRPDPDWHAQGLGAGLTALQPALEDGGRLVIVITDGEPVLLESILIAVSDGWRVSETQFQGNGGLQARLICRTSPGLEARAGSPGQPTVGGREHAGAATTLVPESEIAETILEVLRARAEPVGWSWLQAAIASSLARSGRLTWTKALPELVNSPTAYLAQRVRAALISSAAQVVLESPAFEGEEEHWWLAEWDRTVLPLADRVEMATGEILAQKPDSTQAAFAEAIYRRFPGLLTPAAEIVQACFSAYADRHREQVNSPQTVADLLTLGQRLGFTASGNERDATWCAIWAEEGRIAYAFALSSSAILTPVVLHGQPPPEGCEPCLVLPGAMAKLAAVKLRRDGRLRQAASERGWLFAKAHLIRELAQSPSPDRHLLKTIWGLEPIAEQTAAQIPLL